MGEIDISSGERLETFIFNDNTLEHLHRYAITFNYIKNKVVLDIACGEGYGSNFMADYATKVFGVDISINVVDKARQKYRKSNIEFSVGSTVNIPLESGTIDVVVSFETLEHHDRHDEMIKEIKRVLKKDGLLIISTPEKNLYSDVKDYKNPFHIKELYFNEFRDLIDTYFSYTQYFYQNIISGSLIMQTNSNTELSFYRGDYEQIKHYDKIKPLYVIAIAAESEFIKLNDSIFTNCDIRDFQQDDIYKKLEVCNDNVNSYQILVDSILNSWSYRFGNLLIKPFSIIKKAYRKSLLKFFLVIF